MASISAVELNGTDSSSLHDDFLAVEYNNALNVDDSVVVCEDLNMNDSVINSENSVVNFVSIKKQLNFHDIQSLIDDAPAGSTLELDVDYINEDGSFISINKDLTIDGKGHTIDLNQYFGIKSDMGNICLKNLKIINGNSSNAVKIYGPSEYTGAIFIGYNASYVINNCSFWSNFGEYGGAVNSIGTNPLFIINSTFLYNSASIFGGAVYSNGNIFLENSVFGYSRSHNYGGAVRTFMSVNIDGCTFLGNSAYISGGAVYAESVSMEKTPSVFMDNSADTGIGGAIFAKKFNTDVYNAMFLNNHAGLNSYGKDGGAIYIHEENHVTFESCLFGFNRCSDEGGAIYLDSSKSHLSLRNNIFINNSATCEGQSVYNCGYYDVIENNFWGFNNPSSDNDQLIEWKATIFQKNVHHSDSNPLSIVFDFDKSHVSVNETVKSSLHFMKSDGTLFAGRIYGLCDVVFKFNENLKEIKKE